jgi:hypothetical protein
MVCSKLKTDPTYPLLTQHFSQSRTLTNNYADKTKLLNQKSRNSMYARIAYDQKYFGGKFNATKFELEGDFIPDFNISDFDVEFDGLTVLPATMHPIALIVLFLLTSNSSPQNGALDGLIADWDVQFADYNRTLADSYFSVVNKARASFDDAQKQYDDLKNKAIELQKAVDDAAATV